MTDKNKKNIALIIYIILFYAVWTLYTFYADGPVGDSIKNAAVEQIVKEGIIKNLVWTLPAMLLVHHFSSDVYIKLKEMFCTKVKWLRYLPVFILFTAYVLGSEYLSTGKLEVNKDFGAASIVIVLFVGITEEMVFRGWLLNATVKKEKQWLPIAVNAVLFTLIHFPIWIVEGTLTANITSFGFLFIAALSVIFSITFLKSRSIVVPVLLHMYWDLLAFMFF